MIDAQPESAGQGGAMYVNKFGGEGDPNNPWGFLLIVLMVIIVGVLVSPFWLISKLLGHDGRKRWP